jgi:hypothetical protein
LCRRVDNSGMPRILKGPRPRKIVGFSLPPALASEVKAEAGRRSISLRRLFEELWALYQKQPAKSRAANHESR